MTPFERGTFAVVVAMLACCYVVLWAAAALAIVRRRFDELNFLLVVVFVLPFFVGLCWLVGWCLA